MPLRAAVFSTVALQIHASLVYMATADDCFRVGDHTGVERLRSTLRRHSRVIADDRCLYRDPARA
jgi:hypothetical protein